MNRIFLGIENDVLESVAKRLLESAIGNSNLPPDLFHPDLFHPDPSSQSPIDLRDRIVVIPGRRAGRRLRQRLIDSARTLGRGLLPPQITTPGQLEETVSIPEQPFTTVLEDRIAWLHALRSCTAEMLQSIGIPTETDRASTLLPLAKLLSRLCSDLRRDGITLGQAAELTSANDPQAALRLRTVERIEAQRSARIRQLDLSDSGSFTTPPHQPELQIILVGILEIPLEMRRWLEQHDNVEVWIDAKESASKDYDDFGCPIPESWEGRECPAPVDLLVADDPRSLTAMLIQQIDAHCAGQSVDQISIGLVDQELGPWIKDGFRKSNIPLHLAGGTPHSETSCGRLISDLQSSVETLSSHGISALARHPAIHRNLPEEQDRNGTTIDPVPTIDRWLTRRQPVLASDSSAPVAVQQIRNALAPLLTEDGDCQQRIKQLLKCLSDLVGTDDQDQPALPAEGLDGLIKAVESLSRIGDRDDGLLSGLDTIALITDMLEDSLVPDQNENSGIDVLGWLELPFDEAPVLLLTGPTEGRLSPAPEGDPLLPHGVREELGMSGPRQRNARDAHILQTLLDGRRKTVIAMCARNGDGNPLLPSRLLLQGPQGIDRLDHFLDKEKRQRFHLPETGTEVSSPDSLGPPSGTIVPPPLKVATTAFADWLQDPVLFQMNRVLNLRDCHDRDHQLNPADFGNLIHTVLERYGKDLQLRDLSDEDEIRDALHLLLDQYRKDRIADPARSAVLVQLEQARVRLDAWAKVQAHQRALGWRLVAAEISLDPDRCRIVTSEGEIGVSGRIDRIDFHEQNQCWRLLDYKTGDSGHPPEKDHRKGRKKDEKNWIKLQLPLYRMFADQIEIDGISVSSDVEVGFFLLPAAPQQTRIEIAHWDAEDMESARKQTQQAAAGILTGCEETLSVLKAPWQRAFAGVVVESAARLDGILESAEEEEEHQ
ncbi:MAG: PD-(D/E)XK nuclease family protein [Planctomycetota bacterium]